MNTGKTQQTRPRANTAICGLHCPHYYPPEMILSERAKRKEEPEVEYGREVDWWCLGLCLYTMITGKDAFTIEAHYDINGEEHEKYDPLNPEYEQILKADFTDKNRKGVAMKRAFSKDPRARNTELHVEDDRYNHLIDFVRKCLVANPEERFGDFETARKHPFLSGVDWSVLLAEDGHTDPKLARQLGITAAFGLAEVEWVDLKDYNPQVYDRSSSGSSNTSSRR